MTTTTRKPTRPSTLDTEDRSERREFAPEFDGLLSEIRPEIVVDRCHSLDERGGGGQLCEIHARGGLHRHVHIRSGAGEGDSEGGGGEREEEEKKWDHCVRDYWCARLMCTL